MRRFIASLPGKIFAQLVVFTLLVPFFSLNILGKAEAQVQLLPTIAVTEFHDLHTPGSQYGAMAQEAVQSEIAHTDQFTPIPTDTVSRAIQQLGLVSPITGHVNLMRVGQQLRANSIVSGEIAAIRFQRSAAGKQAFVAMRVVVYDVASGDPVNGAVVEGQSILRPDNVSDETLIGDAIQQAANLAVSKIQQQTLPTATILNTLTDRAYINQGARTGFQTGMQVIVTRGAVEVATGRVSTVESDQSLVMIEHSFVGISPGDHVRTIFNVPDIDLVRPFTPNLEGVETKRQAHFGNNSSLVSLLLVVGLAGVLLGGGGSTNQEAASNVSAQDTLYNGGVPTEEGTLQSQYGAYIQWNPNGWAKGFNERAAWQVWRNDQTTAPVAVTPGTQPNAYDISAPGSTDNNFLSWTYFGGVVGGSTCVNTAYGGSGNPGIRPPVAGNSYTYQVELVYGVSSLDLPIVSSTGTGSTGTTGTTTNTTAGTSGTATTSATTSTSTTSTSTTSSTASTGGTGGVPNECYFISQRTNANGVATPIQPPVPITPTANTPVGSSQVFTFTGVARQFPLLVDYVIQFSTSQYFPADTTKTFNYTFQEQEQGTATAGIQIETPPITIFGKGSALPPAIQAAPVIFYRIGAKIDSDFPGPLPDQYTKQRYVFSLFEQFTPSGRGVSSTLRFNTKGHTVPNHPSK